MAIIFKCRMPPNVSANHLYARRASGANYLKAEVVAFRRDLAILCRKAMGARPKLEGGVMVHMLVGLHPSRRRDVDNAAAKNVLDALKGIAFGDDSVVDAAWPERVCDLARDEMIVIIRNWTMRSVVSAMTLTNQMICEQETDDA